MISSQMLRRLVFPTVTVLLLALSAKTLIAGGVDPLDGVKDFHAIGAGPALILSGCSTASGTLRGEPIGNAQYTLALNCGTSSAAAGACPAPAAAPPAAAAAAAAAPAPAAAAAAPPGGCPAPAAGTPSLQMVSGTLTLTKENGSVLVMNVSLVSMDGLNTAFGTYTAPSAAGSSANKFQGVSGAGSLVFGFGTASTLSTLHIDGVLVFPDPV
jgi:hypothetical protein